MLEADREVVDVLNSVLGSVVSVGMNPDFNDLALGDSPWLIQTQKDAVNGLVQAIRLIEGMDRNNDKKP